MRKINYDESWNKDLLSFTRAYYIASALFTSAIEHINICAGSGFVQISAFSHSDEERKLIENTITKLLEEGESMETRELTGLGQITYCTNWEKTFENWKSTNDD